MIERTITLDGQAWTVSLAGRSTAYERDEIAVVFARRDGQGAHRRRVARFSPLGNRNRASAFQELTDLELEGLFRQSQPDWTSPELDYAGS